jgi:hypothetical protein
MLTGSIELLFVRCPIILLCFLVTVLFVLVISLFSYFVFLFTSFCSYLLVLLLDLVVKTQLYRYDAAFVFLGARYFWATCLMQSMIYDDDDARERA